MGRLSELHEDGGFIQELFQDLQSTLTAEQIKNFANLENDRDRFKFVSQIDNVKKFEVLRNGIIKNATLALDFKQKGNDAFKQQNWNIAVDYYNKGLLLLPGDSNVDCAILLANRSAALYHMEKYDRALHDIDLAEENYPIEMMYKLKERTARCYLALKQYRNALKSFKETITALDESKIPMEKRGKIEKDAQIMIKLLPKQVELEMKLASMEPKKAKASDSELNDAVAFDYNEQEGRFAKAQRNMRTGESVLTETPICATLSERFSKSHCQHCFTRTVTPVPCPQCVDVVFCSKTCRNAAIYGYHKFECGLLETIWKSGSSINCHMAMRLISQRPLSYFKSIQNQLSDNLNFDDIKKLPSHDYRRAFIMVRHEKDRPIWSFLQYAFMAKFLVSFLAANQYFNSDISTGTDELKDNDKYFIGGLLLRNLQLLQFNSHEVFDLLKSRKGDGTHTVAIGAGLYSHLALFNHSCNPAIVRYFTKTAVHVVAIRNVEPGERLTENYGPLYSQNAKDFRREKLKKFYWFDCNCEACEQNWPVFGDMNTNEIRFKCNGTKSCDNVITVPENCNDFMIQCVKCGKYSNIMTNLKAVQDTEILEKTAKRLAREGRTEDALKKYYEIMRIFDTEMVPPFQDYCKCQQAIKECLLEYGNKIQID